MLRVCCSLCCCIDKRSQIAIDKDKCGLTDCRSHGASNFLDGLSHHLDGSDRRIYPSSLYIWLCPSAAIRPKYPKRYSRFSRSVLKCQARTSRAVTLECWRASVSRTVPPRPKRQCTYQRKSCRRLLCLPPAPIHTRSIEYMLRNSLLQTPRNKQHDHPRPPLHVSPGMGPNVFPKAIRPNCNRPLPPPHRKHQV